VYGRGNDEVLTAIVVVVVLVVVVALVVVAFAPVSTRAISAMRAARDGDDTPMHVELLPAICCACIVVVGRKTGTPTVTSAPPASPPHGTQLAVVHPSCKSMTCVGRTREIKAQRARARTPRA
jgi:hypothetical protein